MMYRVIAIVGPTAVGKSSLAMRLARRFQGEIVSGDSRHVYKYLDIGTNKPTPEERAQVPHHLLDIIYPDGEYSLSHYRRDADLAICRVGERGSIAYLVGGTGLYVRALLENWQVPAVAPDLKFRASLEKEAKISGIGPVFARLSSIDEDEAARIGPDNLRRMIRALEIHRATGIIPSRLKQKGPSRYVCLLLGLTCERAELYARINKRVRMMIQSGLVDEVKHLVSMGYDLKLPALTSIGYRETGRFIEGNISFDEAIEQIQNGTHRLARQQYTWLRPLKDTIKWVDSTSDPYPEAEKMVRHFLEEDNK
jgi:tRNA dimethylallyltransferase